MGIKVIIDYNFLVYVESVLFASDDCNSKCTIPIGMKTFFMRLKFPFGFRKFKLRVRVQPTRY